MQHHVSICRRPGGSEDRPLSSIAPDISADNFRVGKTSEVSRLYSSPAPVSSLTSNILNIMTFFLLLKEKLLPGKSMPLSWRMLPNTTENLLPPTHTHFTAALPFSGANSSAFSTLGTHTLQNDSFPSNGLFSNYQGPLGKKTLGSPSHALAPGYREERNKECSHHCFPSHHKIKKRFPVL